MHSSKSLLAKAFNITPGPGSGGITASRPNNDGKEKTYKVAIGPGT